MSKEKQINNCKNCNSQKEEKIKELAKDLCNSIVWTDLDGEPLIDAEQTCAALYDIGYRKQSEGEWLDTGDEQLDKIYSSYKCSVCGFVVCGHSGKYCSECGAKMKGGTYAV